MRYYQYKQDRAQRTLRGIDEQVAKAEQAGAGMTAVERNRFVTPLRLAALVDPAVMDQADGHGG